MMKVGRKYTAYANGTLTSGDDAYWALKSEYGPVLRLYFTNNDFIEVAIGEDMRIVLSERWVEPDER